MSPNQIVAFNLHRARILNNWTQETAAAHLAHFLGEHWSKASFSAAERSVSGERIREFTANDLIAFAATFNLDVAFFLTPPRGVDSVAAPGATVSLSAGELADVVGSPSEEKVYALEVAHVEELQAKGVKAQLARSAPASKPRPRGQRKPAKG